jgi:hypothetical protein
MFLFLYCEKEKKRKKKILIYLLFINSVMIKRERDVKNKTKMCTVQIISILPRIAMETKRIRFKTKWIKENFISFKE